MRAGTAGLWAAGTATTRRRENRPSSASSPPNPTQGWSSRCYKRRSRRRGRWLPRDWPTTTSSSPNHSVTGRSELLIRTAFEGAGVGRCRIFGYEWIVRQIRTSPRLYGLGDLSDLLDARAYGQAQLILSAMGDDLQRLVMTDADRRSVRAISAHNLVLLLERRLQENPRSGQALPSAPQISGNAALSELRRRRTSSVILIRAIRSSSG
jgi:hypothetical protein